MGVSAAEALRRLMDGNRRFREDPLAEAWSFQGPRLAEMAAGQAPFAAVLGCSDSRVPVEVVFGQGAGRLFVVRVAGNVVAPTQLGSLEFAVRRLGVRLVVVLGHSTCGAVAATLEGRASREPDYLRALTSRIARAIAPVLDEPGGTAEERLDRAVRLNVEASRCRLLEDSGELGRLHGAGRLRVASAVYDVATGAVELVDPDEPRRAPSRERASGARRVEGP